MTDQIIDITLAVADHIAERPVDIVPNPERADLAPWSDGRPWDPDLVGRELRQCEAAGLIAQYEAGRRLLWARSVLGHGEWLRWLEQHYPLHVRTAQQRMALAEFVGGKKRLLAALGDLSAQKVRLLAQLPEQDLQELEAAGTIAGRSLSEIAATPYAVLERDLRQAREVAERAEGEIQAAHDAEEAAKAALTQAQARIAELSDRRARDEDALLDELARVHRAASVALIQLGQVTQAIAERLGEERDPALARLASARGATLSSAAAARLVAVVEGVVAQATHEAYLARMLLGDDSYGAAYSQLLADNAALPRDAQIPASRVLPGFAQ